MRVSRRQLIAGAAALGMMPSKAEAWFPHGSQQVPITKLRIVGLAGQSNMAGRALSDPSVDTDPTGILYQFPDWVNYQPGGTWSSGVTYPQYAQTVGSDNNYYLSVNAGNIGNNPVGDGGINWVDVNFQHEYHIIQKGISPLMHEVTADTWNNLGFNLGPWQSFAVSYATNKPDAALLLVPGAVGGSSMLGTNGQWEAGSPGEGDYEHMITLCNLAYTAGVAQYGVGNVTFEGFLWAQGESDCTSASANSGYADAGHTILVNEANYQSALEGVRAGFRARISGASNAWFCTIGMMEDFISNLTPYGGYVDYAQQGIVTSDSLSRTAYVPGLTGVQYDLGGSIYSEHYSALGYRTLGPAAFTAVAGF